MASLLTRSQFIWHTPFRCLSTTSPKMNFVNYYDLLEVSQDATLNEIKVAFYRQAKLHHPDANRILEKDHVRFQAITEAYEVLSDPNKRRAYDATIPIETNPIYRAAPFLKRPPRKAPPPKTPGPPKPLNMAQVKRAYEALQRDDDIQPPRFSPVFENHNYEGSNYNKYLYTRTWDLEEKRWVYKLRKDAEDYNKWLFKKDNRFRTLLTVCTVGFLMFFIKMKFFSGEKMLPELKTERFDEDGNKFINNRLVQPDGMWNLHRHWPPPK